MSSRLSLARAFFFYYLDDTRVCKKERKMHGTLDNKLGTFYIAFNKHTNTTGWRKDGLVRPALSTCPSAISTCPNPQTPTCNNRHNLLQI